MSIPLNAYVFDYKDDETTNRFYKKIMEAIASSERIGTPNSNSSTSSKPANPLQDIINIAFSSAPETVKSLNPVIDIIMDAFTTIATPETQKPPETQNPPEVKKTVSQLTANAACCPVTKCGSTVCTGLQAQCNATASTQNSNPPGVGLEFSVGGNVSGATQSGCPFIGPKTKDVLAKREKLRAEVKTLSGGDAYLKSFDTDTDNVIAHLLEKEYQEMLSFRETANRSVKVRTSIADVVHRLKPNVLLPENAKTSLITYVNAKMFPAPIMVQKDFCTVFEVTQVDNELINALVTQWLNENSNMYVVV
jgi:hypothetical protein